MSQDALSLHLRAARELPWAELAAGWPAASPAELPPLAEVHAAYVQRFDAFRDEARAARTLSAIQSVSARAQAGEELGWPQLQEVQAEVLGLPAVGFRSEPAYANARMEVYGADPRLEGAYAKALAAGAELHPLLRACRRYLYTCFFHPFAEANGSAARLAFQWTLEGAGLRLPELSPLFRQRLRPGELADYRALIERAGALLAQRP